MADGSIEFATTLDNADLEKKLKQAEQRVESLKKKIEGEHDKRALIEVQMERASKEVEAAGARVDKLREKLEKLQALEPSSPAEWSKTNQQIDLVKGQLGEAEKEEQKLLDAHVKLEKEWQSSNDKVRVHTEQLAQARARQAELGGEYARSYSKFGNSASAAFAQAEASFSRLSGKVATTMRRVFVFALIGKAVKALKSAITGALSENERYAASWANLGAVIQGIANFVAGYLAPVLAGFVNMVAAMITTLARLVDSVFKTNITGAIERARAAAQATDNQAKATKNLAKATKEASKQLLAFDEINAMNADSSNDAGGPGDLGGGASGLDWGAFDVGKIDDKLAEIMLILGAALLAVGAVLAFSGINIPLGLTLMAIGALMIYTAYQEQWDKLPQEVRSAITGMLVVAGVVLLLLGAVLAFAGPATAAIGIGMMAAGAATLWTAVALNWDSMSQEMKGAVSALMLVLGAALLVIGAILCLSGAGTPLGIGLMLAGAATLAGVAAINWDSMPDEIRSTVTVIMGILGGALLAVGAILALSAPVDGPAAFLGVGLMLAGAAMLGSAIALNWDSMPDAIRPVVTAILSIVGGALIAVGAILCFSGAAAPLGIALIAAGAASLAAAAALNWNYMRDSIEGTVGAILGILGGALLVIGVILCATGVGVPLGVALVLAGAASLIASTALNWNFFRDKVEEVWNGIVGFWNNNIAQVFTAQWWGERLSPIGQAANAAWQTLQNGAANAWNGVMQVFSNVAGYFGAIFGNAWVAVKNAFVQGGQVFNGVVGAVTAGFKGLANNLIGGFNWALAQPLNWLNSILAAMRSWEILKVKPFAGFANVPVPKIPYLAQGAVIPPNREFMAVLGDQSNGRNLEAPEGLIRQIVREESGSAAMQQAVAAALMQVLPSLLNDGNGDISLVLQVGHEQLAQAVNKGNASLARRGLVSAELLV